MIEFPYYHLVPKDLKANLIWRKKVVEEGFNDKSVAIELKNMCAKDILFWVNSFVWTYDPRTDCKALPFVTYDFQDNIFREIKNAVNHHDLLFDKSRDLGLSWINLLVPQWFWQFHYMYTFLLVSRVEDLVDKRENPDSLFWKIDFALENQPTWLQPSSYNRTSLHLLNYETKSTIDGCSTTGDISRGGRRSAILFDEFAMVKEGFEVLTSSRNATPCRIFNSTTKGVRTAFYHLKQTEIKKVVVRWWQHPLKVAGRYTSKNGILKIIDQSYKFPSDYPFVLDGNDRSPYIDEAFRRAVHPMEINQEEYGEDLAGSFQFFEPELLERIKKEDIRKPYLEGELEFTPDSIEPKEFHLVNNGRIKLWTYLLANNEPLRTEDYVMGIDISYGTGATPSCFSVVNKKTGEKVAEFAYAGSNNQPFTPSSFAKLCVAVARWFGGIFMIWEANGPGRVFGPAVLETGYRRIYYRKNELSINRKPTDFPGFWTQSGQSGTKNLLLTSYKQALVDKKFINRSFDSIHYDHEQYVWFPTLDIGHSGSKNDLDPTGSNENHGDRVIADALAWWGIKENVNEQKEEKEKAPYMSLAWYREQEEHQDNGLSRW